MLLPKAVISNSELLVGHFNSKASHGDVVGRHNGEYMLFARIHPPRLPNKFQILREKYFFGNILSDHRHSHRTQRYHTPFAVTKNE